LEAGKFSLESDGERTRFALIGDGAARRRRLNSTKETSMDVRKATIRVAVAAALVTGSCASAALAQPVAATSGATASGEIVVAQQNYLDVMANLEAAGYTILETKRTLLGRIKITARNSTHLREVVVSRATGEVKHDEVVQVFLPFGSEGSEGSAQASSGLGVAGGSASASASAGASVGATADGSFGAGGGSLAGSAGVSASGDAGGLGSVSGEVSGGLGSVSGEVSGGLSGSVGIGN
jgi:hypothetical protein